MHADLPSAGSAGAGFGLSAGRAAASGPLVDIYRKSQEQQWNAATDLDWDCPVDPDNPLGMPDKSLSIYGTDLWVGMSDQTRDAFRGHVQSWQVSQILHGEQAALLCAAKIAQAAPDLAVKFCIATQVADEARHIEVYDRLLSEKMRYTYPISESLGLLLENILAEHDYDYALLGMQILVEGVGLGLFRTIQAHSRNPLICEIQRLVLRDEARHFAIGNIALKDLYRELSQPELRQREQFVVEACRHLHKHFCADEVWEPLGLPKKACSEIVRASQTTAELRRAMFRQIVPPMKAIGLLGPEMRAFLASVGLEHYEALPAALPS